MAEACTSLDRRRFLHGTRRVIEFNWPRYVVAICVAASGCWIVSRMGSGTMRVVLLIGVCLALWWTLASVVASWWIYDASGVSNWCWLRGFVGEPARWLNIHVGFDETTPVLESLFPKSEFHAVDIYDSEVTTEDSIERARIKTVSAYAAIRASWRNLPFESASQDAVFLLFAAHEVRSHENRVALFREIARVLAHGGSVVLVEHLRDIANFLAFGPGFMHFLPRRAWTQAAAEAGLMVRHARALTPFVALYIWEKRR